MLFLFCSQSLIIEKYQGWHEKLFPAFRCVWQDPNEVGLEKVTLEDTQHYTCLYTP